MNHSICYFTPMDIRRKMLLLFLRRRWILLFYQLCRGESSRRPNINCVINKDWLDLLASLLSSSRRTQTQTSSPPKQLTNDLKSISENQSVDLVCCLASSNDLKSINLALIISLYLTLLDLSSSSQRNLVIIRINKSTTCLEKAKSSVNTLISTQIDNQFCRTASTKAVNITTDHLVEQGAI